RREVEGPGLAELVAAGLRDRERVVGDGGLVDEEGERAAGDSGDVEEARQREAAGPSEPLSASATRSGRGALLVTARVCGRDPAHRLSRAMHPSTRAEKHRHKGPSLTQVPVAATLSSTARRAIRRAVRRPMDYKATLNLPKTSFPMRANLPQREPETVKRW